MTNGGAKIEGNRGVFGGITPDLTAPGVIPDLTAPPKILTTPPYHHIPI